MPAMDRGVRWILERVSDRPCVFVAGNHEAYGEDLGRTVQKARIAAAGTNVHVLENDVVHIDDPVGGQVAFYGATGWTDFNLFGNPESGMRIAAGGMNDYNKIRINSYQQRLKPRHTLARHLETRAFLEHELQKPKVGRRVVVTHMCFHEEGVPVLYENDPLSVCYCSRAHVEGADLWVYGHTHESRDFRVGASTRVVSNAKGYGPWTRGSTWENKQFDPRFVVEI